MIKLQDGATVRRHVDHVRKRENSIVDQDFDSLVFGPELGSDETIQSPTASTSQEDFQLGSRESEMPSVSQETDSSPTLRRLTQSRNLPDHFGT